MTIPRNLSFLAEGASSTGVLSPSKGGTGLTTLTAGYIPYGNGTSAFSSSSNLQFNGTQLGIGGSPFNTLDVFGGNIRVSGTSTPSYLFNDGVTQGSLGYTSSTFTVNSGGYPVVINAASTQYIALQTNTTERMRLFASGGVSIGNTTDPGASNLSVTGTVISSTIGAASGNSLSLKSNGTTYATLDTSGNLGLGVTTSAWGFGGGRLELVNSSFIIFQGEYGYIGTNWYYNGGFLYKTSGYAAYYSQVTGQHQWFTAPSGTAGNAITFTQAMTLFQSGGLSIGNTTDPGAKNLSVSGTVQTQGYTVATLPTGVTGMRAYVTNALAPTYGSTVVGGGTVTIPVFYNGTNWIVA